ncbi:hypothetical protein [Micromonospora sp. KC213]|uniref:hypothetical protein n=1 Tax=Micromonospora sp. KC213 TaxID=2530378 RepID=UPI001FB7A14E|nr:hypothetical protein [Micromonospora sp. KC213]
MSEVLHEGVAGDDRLGGAVGTESAYRSEPVLELAVVGLDRIVGMPFDVVPRRRDQVLEHPRIERVRVGDNFAGRDLQRGQRSVEEPSGRGGVPTR